MKKGGFKAADIKSISAGNSPKTTTKTTKTSGSNAFAKGDATPAKGK